MGWFQTKESNIEIPGAFLKKALNSCYLIAKSAQDPILHNVLLKINGDLLKLCAGDQSRIIIMHSEITSFGNSNLSALISLGDIENLLNINTDYSSGKVAVTIDNDKFKFCFDNSEFIAKYQSAKTFPDLQSFIPPRIKETIKVNRKELLIALEGVLSSMGNSQRIKIETVKNKMLISPANNQPSSPVSVAISYSGSPLWVYFNIHYLIDFLTTVATEENIELELDTLHTPAPCTIRGIDYIFCALPMASI